jgi:F0F1-type ATP synthase assembly protein I
MPTRLPTAFCLFIIFRHRQQFFSYMMAISFYWRKREPIYFIQYIWEEATDLPFS